MMVAQKPSSFERLKSNAIGNPYSEPANYDLRKPGPRGAGLGCMNSTMRGTSYKTPFVNSGACKTIKNSEFERMSPLTIKIRAETKIGFHGTSKSPKMF